MVSIAKSIKLKKDLSEMEAKILEMKRQHVAMKETTYKDICRMESCARDLGVELEDMEFEFE
ncbi:unnamed protein product [Thlaspi arvense]|uniref:Uncharacterized protein n=1 Tax=Thlaspi arvense TaxID=13288 RepID=A0AAU9S8Z9_THLAR|nr:unnamed protein product [Thlaspi arvense]